MFSKIGDDELLNVIEKLKKITGARYITACEVTMDRTPGFDGVGAQASLPKVVDGFELEY